MPLPRALEPFRLGRYRVLAFAMFSSVFGAGMWAVALVHQVLQLDGTAVDLSAVTAVGALGMLVFVLVGGIDDPPATFRALLDRGILVRDVGIPHHLRVTAGTEPETTAFLTALEEVLGETGHRS